MSQPLPERDVLHEDHSHLPDEVEAWRMLQEELEERDREWWAETADHDIDDEG